jgi:phage terminase large subunit-like protein
VSHATAHDNPHADPLWLEELERMYRGTRLYAQEVLGQVLEDVEGALWAADNLDRSRVQDIADLYAYLEANGRSITRAAVGVDPANSTGTTGIVAVLMSDDRHLYVVEDASMPGRSAEQWARVAVDTALKWNAVLVPENDSGGDAIRAVLKAADLMDEVSIFPARARGVGSKGVRAEPISLLWERDDFRAHLVGTEMRQLEDQMLTFVPDLTGQESPDHLDAMVWACTYLWGRASFSEMSSSWPNSAYGQPGAVTVRRPGEVLPWRARSRHAKKEKAG